MVYTKRTNVLLVSVVAVLMLTVCCCPVRVYAEDKPSNEESAEKGLTETQLNAIMQNCGSIKQSLQQLQHVDSRTRTYLGSAYEAISGRFITPLNLRLVKLGKPSTELFAIQNDFTDAQSDFRNEYVNYMREMETLVAIDCAAHPEEFYRKLETVRQKREELRLVTEKLSELAQEQYKAVENLRGKL